jgi:predicted RNA-binding Zn ribbon-like protein
LRTPADLDRWLAGQAIAAAAATDGDLVAARSLREAIYRLLRARLDGAQAPRTAVRTLNAAAAMPPPAPRLGSVASSPRAPVSAALSLLAREAIELLGSAAAERVRECASGSCSVLFLDRSRAGRRRWCSMKRCGNRAKTATYREHRRRRTAVRRA